VVFLLIPNLIKSYLVFHIRLI